MPIVSGPSRDKPRASDRVLVLIKERATKVIPFDRRATAARVTEMFNDGYGRNIPSHSPSHPAAHRAAYPQSQSAPADPCPLPKEPTMGTRVRTGPWSNRRRLPGLIAFLKKGWTRMLCGKKTSWWRERDALRDVLIYENDLWETWFFSFIYQT